MAEAKAIWINLDRECFACMEISTWRKNHPQFYIPNSKMVLIANAGTRRHDHG